MSRPSYFVNIPDIRSYPDEFLCCCREFCHVNTRVTWACLRSVPVSVRRRSLLFQPRRDSIVVKRVSRQIFTLWQLTARPLGQHDLWWLVNGCRRALTDCNIHDSIKRHGEVFSEASVAVSHTNKTTVYSVTTSRQPSFIMRGTNMILLESNSYDFW